MTKVVVNDIPDTIPPLPVFSQAVISKGHVYVSGSVGCDNEYNIVVGGVQVQAKVALENMMTVLKGSGSRLDDVVKVTVYMSNLARDFGGFNEAYKEFFKNNSASESEGMPARTCVGVASLPLGALVEIECIAELAMEEDSNID